MNEQRNAVLSGAIDYLREYGWTRGALTDEDGSACLLGSICASFAKEKFASPAPYLSACSALEAINFGRFANRCIPTVNDTRIRDCDEAIELLKLAMDES